MNYILNFIGKYGIFVALLVWFALLHFYGLQISLGFAIGLIFGGTIMTIKILNQLEEALKKITESIK